MKTLREFIADCVAERINGQNYYGETFGVQPRIVGGQQDGWEFAVQTEKVDQNDPSSFTGFIYDIPADVVIGR